MKLNPSHIFMIKPIAFGFNQETSESNSFQQADHDLQAEAIQNEALIEFNSFVFNLTSHGIKVDVFDDTPLPHTPDSIYPNNWISFHEQNFLVLYPMLAKNRRDERRSDIIDYYKTDSTNVINIAENEKNEIYLEGTGSIVFDYQNKIAYANISRRTNVVLFEALCNQLTYTPIAFTASDNLGNDIYHTNVLMCIGSGFCVLCKEVIRSKKDLDKVISSLQKSNKSIIEINQEQMNAFAGNMYQLFNDKLESFIVMSEQAYQSLSNEQINLLQAHGTLLHSKLDTIEKYGGGSARCMIAEVMHSILICIFTFYSLTI